MIKKTWRKSSLLPISIIITVAAILLACAGGDDPDNYPASFFAPEITHNDRYAMFFRSYHFLYVGDNHSEYEPIYNFKVSYVSDFNNINLTEWSNFFTKKVTKNDLSYILYKARLGEIDTLIFSIKKPGYPITIALKSNSVLKIADTRSTLDFLYYVGFAKRCEKYATYEADWWDERTQPDPNDPKNDKAGMAALLDGGLKQITNTKNSFVEQRYAFQLLRLYYMTADYAKCIQFYATQKSVIESIPNSIFYRSEGYLAGAYFKQKQYSNANYLYSLIYDQYDTMKVTAYFSFKPQEEKDWQQTLAMAKSPREKAVLWQLFGIYDDPLRAMKEIYALDPKSDLLDLLLGRAVNEAEETFIYQPGEFGDMEMNGNSVDSSGILKSTAVDKELVDFLKMLADKGNTTKPYEWDLAAGYMDWASGDRGFEKYLSKAKSESRGDLLVLDNVRLIELLDMVNTAKAGDKKFEENIISELAWLNGKHPEDFRGKAAQDFIRSSLTHKYLAIGDTIKSVCISGVLNKHTPHFRTRLTEVLAFLNKKNKTPFEEYTASQLQYSSLDILDMLALRPFYDRNLKAALSILDIEDNAGGLANFGDPFVIHINDCHDCDANDHKKNKYTVKSFIRRMIGLQDSVKTDSKHAAQTYLLLANGCYNMSYYGNCRVFYSTKLTEVGDGYFDYRGDESDSSEIDNMQGYFSCALAEDYYNKAMAASTDPEFKAKCVFMAAKCAQNDYYTSGGSAMGFDGGKYFPDLKKDYSSTKYYQEVIKECGYFRTYLGIKTQ